MSLSTTTNRVSFAGNGATVAFSFPYYFLQNADLIVILRNSAGTESTKVINTDYTITGAGVAAGGTVTMVIAPATGETLVIYRDPTKTQDLNLVENDPLPAEEVEKRFDKAMMIDQRISDRLDRAITLKETDSTVGLQIPLAADRASKVLAFDASGNIVASAVLPSSTVVTPFMTTLLDDVDAATARTTLGVLTAAQQGGSTLIGNAQFTVSVAANACTVALKTNAGTDPSATDPVYVVFRSSTATSGAYVVRTITAALSITIPSLTTLGTVNAVTSPIFIFFQDNAGAVELALSLTSSFDEGSVKTTTAISGGSSATTLYSTTARTGVGIRLAGRFIITEATAGTWATAPTEISGLPFRQGKSLLVSSVQSSTGTLTGAGYAAFTNYPSLTFTPSRTGRYRISGGYTVSDSTGSSDWSIRLIATSGSPTVVYSKEPAITQTTAAFNVEVCPFTICDLIAGTSYTFRPEGKTSAGTLTLSNSSNNGSVVIAEEI